MATTAQQQHKELVRRFMEEVQNEHRYEVINDICQPDQLLDHPEIPEPVRGTDILEEKVRQMETALPDMHFTIEDLVAEGDQVAVRFTVRGTQTGPFGPVKATGKSLVQTGMAVYDVSDGKLAAARIREDLLQMLDQMGVIPDNPRMLYWMNKLGVVKLLQAVGKIPK
jgi:steroid delta-isomerase-like uncharacterized protein